MFRLLHYLKQRVLEALHDNAAAATDVVNLTVLVAVQRRRRRAASNGHRTESHPLIRLEPWDPFQ